MYTLTHVNSNARYGVVDAESYAKTPEKAGMVFSQRLFEGNPRKEIRSTLTLIGRDGNTHIVQVVRKRLVNTFQGYNFVHYVIK